MGQVSLYVRLGKSTVRVVSSVCKRLAALVILECDFNDEFIEAIYPRRKEVELTDWHVRANREKNAEKIPWRSTTSTWT